MTSDLITNIDVVNIDMAMAETAEELGPLIRLWGITTAQLPATTATADDLAPFLISLLQEAVPFVDSVAPKIAPATSTANPTKQLWKPKGTKSSHDSTAKVELLERTVPSSELDLLATRNPAAASLSQPNSNSRIPPETWICRRSVHGDAAVKGSASWAEFRDCLKDRHAETEDAFTPAVVSARSAMVWDCSGVAAVDEGGERWGAFSLRVEEMRHRIGRPLKDRTFPVLQMTCAALGEGKREFLVVSITVSDFKSAPQAQLSREKGVVVGMYASVERVRKLRGVAEAEGDIEWIMATASNAKGVLPMWVQTMAVPGQIAKDVPLFLAWLARERAGEKHPETAEGAEKKVNGTNGKPQEPLVRGKANVGGLPLLPNPILVPAASVPATTVVIPSEGTVGSNGPVPALEPVKVVEGEKTVTAPEPIAVPPVAPVPVHG